MTISATTAADQLNSGAMLAVTRNICPEPPFSAVTALAYDTFGKRLACASLDTTVRIRDLDENGQWRMEDGCEIRPAHAGMICKVCWAHPEFGQLLATCSHDGFVKIWEEQIFQAGVSKSPPVRWHQRLSIEDGRTVVNDVQFAPKHLGLKIATASGDGVVRIFDIQPSLNSENAYKLAQRFMPGGSQRHAAVVCLAWCKCAFDCPMLIVGTVTGKVQIWRADISMMWEKIIDLPGHDPRPATGVDWAHDMCRPFYNVASCGADGKLQLHRLSKQRSDYETGVVQVACERSVDLQNGPKCDTESVSWGVEWDRTGTFLKCSGDDGVLRLWQKGYDGNWSRVDGIDERAGAGGGSSGGTGGVVSGEDGHAEEGD